MAQRISRAKQTHQGVGRAVPAADAPRSARERLGAVLHVLYLIFNEGYTAQRGPGAAAQRSLERGDPARRACCTACCPDDGEVAGLLALMLLTDARRAARTGPDGELIPLDEQDRTLWDRDAIAEGVALLTATLPRGAVGAYQLQAAIAARARRGGAAPRTPTGRRSSRSTACCSACPTTRWWRSTTRSPRRWCTARRRGSSALDALDAGRAPRRPPPARRGARAPARAGGRPRGRHRVLPARGRAHDEHAGAELPADAGGAAERAPEVGVALLRCSSERLRDSDELAHCPAYRTP